MLDHKPKDKEDIKSTKKKFSEEHTSHLYGFSPVCVRLCICKAEADEKFFEQTLQTCCNIDDERLAWFFSFESSINIFGVIDRSSPFSFIPLSLCSSLTDELLLFNAAAAAKNGNVLAARFGKNCGLNKLNGDKWFDKFPFEYVDAAAAIAAAKELEIADDFVSSSSSVSSCLIDWLSRYRKQFHLFYNQIYL